MNERTKRVNLAYRWLIWLGEVDDKLSFAQRLGKERANITNILNGKGDASDKFCGIILSSFPGIFNRDWLLDGVGDMLVEKKEKPTPPPSVDFSSYINALLAKSDETIASLKRELSTKDDIIQEKDARIKEKDERIADLEKLAEERLHRIAELRRYIDENNISMTDYPFPIGAADDAKQSRKRV